MNTHKFSREIKLENDEGIGPWKEFPRSSLQKHFGVVNHKLCANTFFSL